MSLSVQRIEAPELLLPLFAPLLRALRRLQAPGARQLQEARALEQRVRALLEQRLCKKKLAFDPAGDDEEGGDEGTGGGGEGGEGGELGALVAAVFGHLQGPQAALRPPALAVLMCLVRAAANHLSNHPDEVTTGSSTSTSSSSSSGSGAVGSGWVRALTGRLQTALHTFATKKNSRLAPKIWCVLRCLPLSLPRPPLTSSPLSPGAQDMVRPALLPFTAISLLSFLLSFFSLLPSLPPSSQRIAMPRYDTPHHTTQ